MTTEALTAIKAALAAGPAGWAKPRAKEPMPLYALETSAISSLISSYEAMERRVARMENALKLGDQLANSCFNLSQSGSVGARQQATLKGLSQQWDAARREVRALSPSGEEQ